MPHLGVLCVDELQCLCQCLDSTSLAHRTHHLQGHGAAGCLARVTPASHGGAAADKRPHQADAGRRLRGAQRTHTHTKHGQHSPTEQNKLHGTCCAARVC